MKDTVIEAYSTPTLFSNPGFALALGRRLAPPRPPQPRQQAANRSRRHTARRTGHGTHSAILGEREQVESNLPLRAGYNGPPPKHRPAPPPPPPVPSARIQIIYRS